MGQPLVSLPDLKTYLSVSGASDDALLSRLLAQATALLNKDCDRARAPFSDALTARVERQEARGGTRLRLDYPIASIASILVGRNFSAPDVTLDPTNPDHVMFEVGGRELIRTDGDYWNGAMGGLLSWQCGGPLHGGDRDPVPTFVQITYTTQPDLPADAALAIQSVVAQIYRRRGSEQVKSESLGQYSYQLADVAAGDSLWQAAVANHRAFEAL